MGSADEEKSYEKNIYQKVFIVMMAMDVGGGDKIRTKISNKVDIGMKKVLCYYGTNVKSVGLGRLGIMINLGN